MCINFLSTSQFEHFKIQTQKAMEFPEILSSVLCSGTSKCFQSCGFPSFYPLTTVSAVVLEPTEASLGSSGKQRLVEGCGSSGRWRLKSQGQVSCVLSWGSDCPSQETLSWGTGHQTFQPESADCCIQLTNVLESRNHEFCGISKLDSGMCPRHHPRLLDLPAYVSFWSKHRTYL